VKYDADSEDEGMDSEDEEDETMDRSTVRDPEASASGRKGKGMYMFPDHHK
jgi:hypothetical protein